MGGLRTEAGACDTDPMPQPHMNQKRHYDKSKSDARHRHIKCTMRGGLCKQCRINDRIWQPPEDDEQ